jgi:predicted nucleic acid-binding protein
MPGFVSDASALIQLAALGRFELLRHYCGEVLVPPAVWREVVLEGRGRPGAQEVEAAAREGWIRVVAPTDALLVQTLGRDLGPGESEAVALAIERGTEPLLVDESDARKVADSYRLRKTGVIGLLIRAKQDGKLASLRQELDALRDECGFRMADHLYQRALQAVGE